MDRMVEHQMRNWELAKSQRLDVGPEASRRVSDFICLSREVGAGAGQIAELVSKRLGWPVFDREILQAMAGDDALSEQVYGSLDERDITWCEEVLRSFLDPKTFKGDFFYKLSKTVLSLARQGSAIFIGRGADLILPADRGLRVRIVAPLTMRISNMARRLSVTEQEARRTIEKLEKLRGEFIQRHFHKDVHDPLRYDLVINLRKMSPDRAAELIVVAQASIQPER
jgi:cytidylate kinase